MTQPRRMSRLERLERRLLGVFGPAQLGDTRNVGDVVTARHAGDVEANGLVRRGVDGRFYIVDETATRPPAPQAVSDNPEDPPPST